MKVICSTISLKEINKISEVTQVWNLLKFSPPAVAEFGRSMKAIYHASVDACGQREGQFRIDDIRHPRCARAKRAERSSSDNRCRRSRARDRSFVMTAIAAIEIPKRRHVDGSQWCVVAYAGRLESGDDAPFDPRLFGIDREWLVRDEMLIAFDRKSEPAAYDVKLGEAVGTRVCRSRSAAAEGGVLRCLSTAPDRPPKVARLRQ
jgi:hypothetical protein